ncbi:response regulator transcription factor [Taibaiella chishuiensis]|uniref:LuxR family two component transcriptional regulator n=1 Tax=Taibaiella chishuiensis TaxID=1434707 RepID=A0A2P8DCR0_9BACT|nr:response regulator transcription factor [Taibaiella chishuiensis]PSK95004.1 LuxR family two component transcriptional regulator [Taibaiella chishuiensis]
MKISIIDDHQIITESLKKLLLRNPVVKEVYTYPDADTFLVQATPGNLPDVIITDLLMPGTNGIEFIEKLKASYGPKSVKMIILSSITDVQTIKHSLRSGADGFLSKNTSIDELMEAILTVIEDKNYIGENLRKNLLDAVFTEEQVVYHLSPREKEVLHKVCSGFTIKEIAYDMNLSVHTVQYYHRNVMNKLKVKRTSDLIVFAMQSGLYIPDIHYNK